uniref:Ovule protein n=1 Tax=Nippostrongylus brasiliensis TaxID=27835 RepID=A0A0N4XQR8_NIPBR
LFSFRSLKLKIKQQTGPFGYRTLGQVVLNSYAHRRDRNPLQACSCVCCTTWMKLIDNNTVPIEAELPLTIVNR